MGFECLKDLLGFEISDAAERRAAKSYSQFFQRLLRFGGFSPLFTRTTLPFRIANIIYYSFIDVIIVQMIFLGIYDVYVSWDGNLSSVSYNMTTFVCYLCLLTMASSYQISTDRLKNLSQFIQTHFGSASVNVNRDRRTRKICTGMCLSTSFGLLIWVLDPLFFKIFFGRKLQLPVQLQYPLDVDTPSRTAMVFMLQSISQCYMALTVANLSYLYITFSEVACQQVDVLCTNLRQAWQVGAIRGGLSRSSLNSISNEGYSTLILQQTESISAELLGQSCSAEGEIDFTQYEDYILDEVNKCIEYHLHIREFLMQVRVYFNLPMASQIASLVFVITISLYSALEDADVKPLSYLMVGSSHLFLFCYYGTIIYNESTRPADAAWEACWWSGTLRATKTLQLLMLHAARPFQLTAGAFFDINLYNYISFMKFCFSFYKLLGN